MKVVFITGATGAIGSRLIPELLKDGDARLKLLIRAKSRSELVERLGAILDFWEVDKNSAGRIEGLAGDITLENLGLDAGVFERLSREVTHIIHCATNIKLLLTIEEARGYTLDGTKRMAGFAKSCIERGQFRRFNYLSTMETAGDMRGPVPEEFISQKRKFLNTYEEAKAETEEFLRQLSKQGFPVTVYRPSMVVGDSQTGKAITFQTFYHLLQDMFLSPPFPIMPCKPEWRLDCVPVDFVAKVIHYAYDRRDYPGRVYNVCAGQDSNVSLGQMRIETRSALEKLLGRKIGIPPAAPPEIFYLILNVISLFCFGRTKKKVLYQIAILKFFFLRQKFENSAMRKVIAEKGLVIPKLNEYIGIICAYYLKNFK